MKKILFLLLCTVSIYGQIVPTGQEQDFDYGIKNTASQLDENATFITVQTNEGVQGKSTSSVWAKKIYVDNVDVKKAFLSTGIIKNGLVTNNGDPSKFNISAGVGIISNFDNPENPISTIVNFPDFIGITPAYLTTGNITYVAINISASVVMQATPFTNIQRRDLIALGAVIHSNLSTINLINNISAPTNAGTNQLHDLMEAIGALNISGNKYSANSANLLLNKSAGDIFKLGVNFANNWRDPNKLLIASGAALTFRYRTQNGTEGLDIASLNPALYDLNNVLTSVPSNRFTIQTVSLFQTGATRIQYGQSTYATMADAEAAIISRSYVVEPNIAANGITRAYIILRNTTTSLLNISDAKIIEAQKFGGTATGGVALTSSSIISALGYTPENIANKSDSYTVSSSTTYASTKAIADGLATKQNTLTSPITGTGTTNYIPKFTGVESLGNSQIFDNGTNVGIGTTSPSAKLEVNGNLDINGTLLSKDNGLVNANTAFKIMGISNPSTSPFESRISLMPWNYNGSTFDFREVLSLNSNLTATFVSTVSATSFNGSASLTGTPTAPTATAGTNTTQIATTAFVQENARPYKVYTALLSQSGTSAPTAIVLENNLGGTVVWSRESSGFYLGTLTGAFTLNKALFLTGNGTPIYLVNGSRRNNDVFVISSFQYATTPNDGGLNNSSIEIRVYN